MHAEFDRQLAETRQERRRRDKLQDTLSRVREEFSRADKQRKELGEKLEKEGTDVKKLEGMSFTNLMVSLFGDKDREMGKEKKELAMAQLAYDEHLEVVHALRDEVAEIEEQLQSFDPDLDARHRDLIVQKEEVLLRGSSTAARQLIELADRIADTGSEAREIAEVSRAGEQAISAMNEVRKQLDSASSWGVVDMIGGGLLTTMIKHGKLDGAKKAASTARHHLDRFTRELRDVQVRTTDLKIDVGGLATFADYFLDGLLFDWIVQSKIGRARDDVNNAIAEVRSITDNLRARGDKAVRMLDDLERQRTEIVGSA